MCVISINMYSIKTETEIWFNKLFRAVMHLSFYKLACHSFVDAGKREMRKEITHINSGQSTVIFFY